MKRLTLIGYITAIALSLGVVGVITAAALFGKTDWRPKPADPNCVDLMHGRGGCPR